MSLIKSILAALILFGAPVLLSAAQRPVPAGATAAEGVAPAAVPAEHGIPQKALGLGREEGFVTNSMLVTWMVASVLILFARMATRQMQEVPAGAQNFWEWLVESLYEFLEGIIGHDLVDLVDCPRILNAWSVL